TLARRFSRMIDSVWIRSTFAFAALVGAVAAGHALVSGCGSGTQENPPSTQAQAQSGDTAAPRGEHHHHTPRPAACDACKDKAVGDACTVPWKDGEINGKCETPPPGSSQSGPACRPEGMRGRPHGPPPEIVWAACDGKAVGDPCSVAFERGTV